jgi:uncharacterized protein YlxW (UPF0749 family)
MDPEQKILELENKLNSLNKENFSLKKKIESLENYSSSLKKNLVYILSGYINYYNSK